MMTQKPNILLIIKLPKSEKAVPRGRVSEVAGRLEATPPTLLDGRNKCIGFSPTGREQFFDPVHDPREFLVLSQSRSGGGASWRDRLNRILNGRPGGFAEAGRLTAARNHSKRCPP